MRTVHLIGQAIVIAALGVIALGCHRGHEAELKSAAAADLNCPKSQIHISKAGAKNSEVEACGQVAKYHWADDDWQLVSRNGVPVTSSPGLGPAGQPKPGQPVNGVTGAPPVTTPTSTPVNQTPTGTPSQPPPNMPPPSNNGRSI